MNAANSDIDKLAYMSPVTATISLGGPSSTGEMAGVSFGMADWLRVRRMTRRRAADCSAGLGSSFEWTSMTKAELTAENRPAYKKGQKVPEDAFQATHKNERGIEVLVVLLDIVHIVLGCLLLVYRIEIETGVVVLYGLEERSERILETTLPLSQRSATQLLQHVERTTSDRFAMVGILSRHIHLFQCPPLVVV